MTGARRLGQPRPSSERACRPPRSEADGRGRRPRRYAHVALLSTALAVLAAMSDPAPGEAAGTWQPAGSIPQSLPIATGILLTGPGCAGKCGQVLVLGTVANSTVNDQRAALFDPRTRAWTATASPRVPRIDATATLLSGPACGNECGEVLLAGGVDLDNGDATATTELYDPSTGTWSPAAPMGTGRKGHSATLLAGGQVLVAGGCDCPPVNPILSTAEIYDPAANTWRNAPPMAHPRYYHNALRLQTRCGSLCGDVLVVGGCDAPTSPTRTCTAVGNSELYDPATGWHPAGGAPVGLWSTLTGLDSGRVLAAGGWVSGPAAVAALFDPVTLSWMPTGLMNTPRSGHSAALLPGGKVLVAGGETGCAIGGCVQTASSELYDPSTGSWAPTGSLPQPRTSFAMVALPAGCATTDGMVLAAGGENGSSSPPSAVMEADLYAPLPKVTGVSPANGVTSGGTSVTLTGTGLGTARTVSFGGTRSAGFTVDSDIRLTVTAPAHSAGTVDVTVTTAEGTSPICPADQYTYYDPPPKTLTPPAVTGVTPDSGPTAGGTPVTVTGSGFMRDGPVVAVRFGDISAAGFRVLSDTLISAAMSPAHAAGSVDVRVTTPAGTSPPSPPQDVFTFKDPVPSVPPPAQPPAPPSAPVPVAKAAAPPGSPPGGVTPVLPAGPGAAPANVVAPAQAPATGQAPTTAQAPGGVSAPMPGAAAPLAPVAQGNPFAGAVFSAARDAEHQAAADYAMTRREDDDEWVLPFAAAAMGAGFTCGMARRTVKLMRREPVPAWLRAVSAPGSAVEP